VADALVFVATGQQFGAEFLVYGFQFATVAARPSISVQI